MVMATTRGSSTRIVGIDWGTALLALAACLFFIGGIAVMTQSWTTSAVAGGSLLIGLTAILNVLREH